MALALFVLCIGVLLAGSCQSVASPAPPTQAAPAPTAATTAVAPAASKPTLAPTASAPQPGERQQWARAAVWAPGQLEAHFRKHGPEGPYSSVAEYDRAARENIIEGTQFSYVDRESRAQRIGFYHAASNRFTSLTSDARRITTFFHPDRREGYVRGLDRSTYR